SLI
ncbi:putative exonuclease SbcC domain protein, partial [Vibrio parahaemolyticus V-223/04]